ncbi:MAG: PAS domain-containing sensor histidine kinase [Candidatus Lokiarchaeota archaeon]|nr:PAS domain-containing sensor histidine kinase [Candidatus Lokiarchaeota archaeon]
MLKPEKQKESNSILKQEASLCQTTFDSLNDSVFIVDLKKKILQCNKATLKFFKKSSLHEVIGLTCCELLSNNLQPLEWCPIENMMKSLQREQSIIQIGDKWLEICADPIYDDENKLIGAVHLISDITQNKLTEIKLKESETKYREAYNRATFYKDLFGHDMSNILTVINSSVDLISYYLGESEKSKNIKSITNIIRNQVNRGAKLISNVNVLSELEESVMPIEPVNVNIYLENSIEFIKTSFKERDLKIDVDSNGSNFKVKANQLLREVFDNVLINAIRYNENSNVEILVNISEELLDNGSLVKLEFIDNGMGVPDERKSMIFKRGNRELKGSKGMGIGLSLVKKILKIYKGKIWVEDKIQGDYSKGSKFILLIPRFIKA